MKYLILYLKGNAVCMAEFTRLPKTLIFDGTSFSIALDYIGDVDYLRDTKQRLIGFSFILGNETEREEALVESLIAQTSLASREDGMLLIRLRPVRFEIESVQAVGAAVYTNSVNDILLTIPDLGFGELGFELFKKA